MKFEKLSGSVVSQGSCDVLIPRWFCSVSRYRFSDFQWNLMRLAVHLGTTVSQRTF